jgi:hypothetical protein
MEKQEVRILGYVTFFALVLIFIGNFSLISDWFDGITGKATATGSVNLTVQTATTYNFTVDEIDWGSGRVDEEEDYAILSTTNGTVANGNWTAVSQGFVIQNTGNVDIIFSISFGKTATDFLGGTSPEYKFNITDNESSSCVAADGFTLDDWNDVSSEQVAVCSNFSFNDDFDEVRIDFYLKIPSDSYMDERGDTLTVNVEAV